MKVNGIEVRKNENDEWEYLSEGAGFDPDAWYPVTNTLGAFGGSGVEQLFDLLDEAAEALRGLQKVVDMLIPGASKIAIQDYQLLNEAPVNAAKLLQKLED